MSKLSYQDSMRDPMVVTNPNTTGLKAPGELLEISAGFITLYSPTKQANPTIMEIQEKYIIKTKKASIL